MVNTIYWSLIVIYFALYSFIGWLHEMLFTAIVDHKLHLQGFLALPLLPIYGFGALGILAATYPYANNPFMVFISAVVVASLLELITSTFLLKMFNLRLWDYARWPLNYKGKISLLSSLGFGVLGLLLLYVIQPIMEHAVSYVPHEALTTVGLVLFVVILIDYIFSTNALAKTKMQLLATNPVISAREIHAQNVQRIQRIVKRFFS